jgi:hypothetical protein
LFYDFIEVRVIFRIRVFGTSIAGLTIIIAYNRNSRKVVSCYSMIYLGYKKVAEYYLGSRANVALIRTS